MENGIKRFLSLAMALIMVIGMMPLSVFATEGVGDDDGTIVDSDMDIGTLPEGFADETEVLEIATAEDLLAFAAAVNAGDNFSGKVVMLTANIDLAGIEWAPIGGDSVYFAGEFDGQGYTISNLTQTTGARMGLFGLVEKAYLHDFTMEDVSFTVAENNARVGAIAGNLQYWNVVEDVTIDGITVVANGNDGLIGSVAGYVWKSQLGNVDVKNAVYTVNGTGNVIGGHTGYGRAHVWDTNVTGNNAHWLEGTVQTIDGTEYVLQNYFVDCDVDGFKATLNGTGSEVGGFFGSDTYNSHSNYFVDCHVTGLDITAAEGTSQIVGGFIAWNNGTTSAGTVKGFDGCSAAGTIKGADGIYGGFAGQIGGRACEYYNASANVDITCTGTAGGFVGATQAYSTHKYTFTDCSAKGDVSGVVAGGFAGKNGMSGDGKSVFVDYVDCSATGTVAGTTYAGGLIGEVNTELPATNWNTVDSTGYLTLKYNTASTVVTGGTVGALIGYLDGVANGDAKEGNKLVVTLQGNVPETGINQSEDTPDEDIVVKLPPVAQVNGVDYEELVKAVEAANAIEGGATVTLLQNVTLGEKLTISGNVTISGEATITRDDAYTGTLFTVNAGATLTLDGGLTIDGGNNYGFNSELYNADLEAMVCIPTTDAEKYFTPEEGAPVATAYMIVLTKGTSADAFGGTVNLNDVTIQNNYSINSGIVSAAQYTETNLNGAKITHVAATQASGVVVNASGAGIKVNMNEGTVIDGNHVGGNHGIFKIYSGTVFTMDGGEVKNTTGWNSNGNVVGLYGGTFIMNGGTICSNSAVYGPSNGRNAAIYLHSNSVMEMNGGTICHNTGRSRGGIDSSKTSSKLTITGGEVLDNISLAGNSTADIGGTVGTWEITGGTFTQDVSAWLAPNTGLVYDETTGTYGVTERVWEMHLTDANGEAHWLSPMYGDDLAGIIESSKIWYDSLQGTYSFTLKLLTNVKIDATAVVDFPLTIDLNGKTITTVDGVVPAFRITNGAEVTVKNGTMDTESYCFILGASDGSSSGNLTIESGKYHGSITVASVTKGTLTVLGGEFSVEPYNGSYEFLLNCIDANYKDGSAQIVVEGGKFHKFNPANNAAEGTGTNFVAEGYLADADGEYYTVRQNKDTMEAVVTITFDDSNTGTQVTLKYPSERYDSIQKLIGTNDYADFVLGATQSELLAYISDGRASNIVMTLHDDIELDAPINFYNKYFQIAAEYGITINGNGHTITWADGYTGTLINVESGVSVTTKNLTIDGENAFTFYDDKTTVENGQNWYTRFVNVGEEDKAVNANVIVNAGNLTLGEGTVIQNVTIASDGDNGKTENTENGYVLKYNDDLAIIKSNGGSVTLDGAKITGNAGMVLDADNTATVLSNSMFEGNMGCGRNGGLFDLVGGTMQINNSSICGNKAMARGATIIGVTTGAVVTMNGNSRIDNNKHIGVGNNTAGSMIVVREGSKFVMNGGSISNNVGGRAGAIASRWAEATANIELNAGTITGNTASNDGWGNASIFLRSPATIGEGMTIDGIIAVNAAPGELDITGGNFTGGLVVTDGLSAEITGGTFSYDPTAWLADGYTVDKNGDTYQVREETYVEWVKAQLLAGNNVTLTEDIVITDYDLVNALVLPSNGNGKYDERHGNGAIFHVIKPGVVLDLNGHSITWDAHDADYCNKRQVSLFMVTGTGVAGETASLTVKDSGSTGKVEIYGMGSGMYVVGVDATGTIEGGTWTNYPCKTCGASNIFIYPSHGGKLNITGGTFEQKDSEYLLGWMGSTKETTNNGVGVDYDETEIVISGGTFVGFNPAEVKFFDYSNGSQESDANGCAPTYVPVDNGDGTYGVELWNGETIYNKYELQAFADMANAGETFSGKTVKLMADIDFEWAEWTAVTFAGTFEGNNHTISNLTYASAASMGFFNNLSGTAKDLTIDGVKATMPAGSKLGGVARVLNGTASNVHIKNITVDAVGNVNWFIGGFAGFAYGYATDCSVENFTVNAPAASGGPCIGGFVGSVRSSHTFKNCDVIGFKATVHSTDEVGLAGFTPHTQTGWNNPKFVDCDVTGIDFVVSGIAGVAGFVAWPGAHTDATNCHTQGKIDVTGVTRADEFAGGFYGNLGWNADLGQMGHEVTNCTADVDIITKVVPAGGFVGSATNSNNASMYATFTNCSAKGDITAVAGGTADIGGFFGKGDRGVYNFCTASGTVTNNGTGYSGTFGGALYDVTPKYDGRYPAGTRDYLVDEITLDNCTATGTATSGKFIGNVADGVKLTIKDYVAQVVETGEKYYSLTEALNACTNGETVKLIADIVYDADDVVYAHGGATGFGDYDQYNPSIIYIGGSRVDEVNSPSKVNAVLDLNGHTITNNADAYLFLIMDNAKLTFKDSANRGALTANTNTPVIWVTGTETLVTVESGKYTTASKDGLIWSTHGGDLVIKGGEFSTSADDASLLIMRNAQNRQNSEYFINGKATVTVTGGTFYGFNPEEMLDDSTTPFTKFNSLAEGYVVIEEEEGIWTVRPGYYVAQVGTDGKKYPSIQAAVEAAQDGDTIVVIADHELTWDGVTKVDGRYVAMVCVAGKAVTIDLNGKALTGTTFDGMFAAFAADEGGSLTLIDSVDTGSVTITGETTSYCLLMGYEAGTKLIVNGGSYSLDNASDSLIYGGGGSDIVTINGGNFYLGNVGSGTNGKPWIFNIYEGNWNSATVNGGTFNSDVNHQFWGNEVYVPENKALKNNGDGTWTIVDAVAYVEEIGTSSNSRVRKIGYATFAEALEAAKASEFKTVVLLAPVVIEEDTTLDLTGVKINGNGVYPAFRIQNNANVTVKGGEIVNPTDYIFVLGASDGSSAGNLTIESGKYQGETTVASVTKGTLTVLGGEFQVNESAYGATYLLNCIDANYNDGSAKIVVKGGSFTGFNPEANAAEGTDTNFCAPNYGAEEENGVWTVKKVITVVMHDQSMIDGNETPELTYTTNASVFTENGETITITPKVDGAVITAVVTVPNADDYVIRVTNGTLTVEAAVAKIGDVYYATLADAIAGANPDDTITLLTDVNENVTVDKKLTIDGANFKYTGTMTLTKVSVTIENVNFVSGTISKSKKTGTGGNFTIKNCTFDGEGLNSYAINLGSTNNIVIENCTANNYFGFLQIPTTNTSVTVKDVEIRNVDFGIKIDYSNVVTLENVTIKDTVYGIMDSNYGVKTYTIKNCSIDATYPVCIWQRNATVVDTFKFEDVNDMGAVDWLYNVTDKPFTIENGSDYAKIVADAQIGTKVYGSFADALAADGTEITLLQTIELTEDTTLDLAGKTITTVEKVVPAFRITNGAEVTVKNGTMDTESYCFILGASDGSSAGNLTIESGSYTGTITVASVTKGTLTVLDGEFQVNESAYGATYLLNCIDANYNDGSAKIIVKGGSFIGFNPENNAAEGEDTNFVAEGYIAEEIEENVWKVMTPVEARYVAQNTETGTYYRDVQKAINEAAEGETVILITDVEASYLMVFNGITLDLNGYTLTTEYLASFGDIVDNSHDNSGVLVVPDDKVTIHQNNAQLPIWNEAVNGYQFVTIFGFNYAVTEPGKYVFQPLFEGYANQLILQGADVSGVTIRVRATWSITIEDIRSQDFVYTDSKVNQVTGSYTELSINDKGESVGKYGKMYSLVLTGVEDITDLKLQVVVLSETGCQIASPVTYINK